MGGGGNKEQRDFQMETTQEFVHLLMDIDLQAQIQTSFQSTLEQLLLLYNSILFPLQIYIPLVCV